MPQIKIRIDKKAKITYEAQGYVGSACQEAEQIFQTVGVVSDKQATGEGHQQQESPAYNELHQQGY